MYTDLLYKLLTTYLSVSFLFAELLHVCAFCVRTAKFSTDPDLSAGGRLCRAVQQLWTDWCSILSALYSWHSGSMGRFSTSTLYPNRTANTSLKLRYTFFYPVFWSTAVYVWSSLAKSQVQHMMILCIQYKRIVDFLFSRDQKIR